MTERRLCAPFNPPWLPGTPECYLLPDTHSTTLCSVRVEKFLLLFPLSCLVSGLGKLPQVDFLNQDGERGGGWEAKAFRIQR